MNQKPVNLEELLEEIRSLSENFETDEENPNIFLIKPEELNTFSDEILRLTEEFISKISDGNPEEELEETDDEFIVMDWFDDDLD